ncbi:hypothetical protein CpipJ_CPIJ008242 [Culex quinquefasciatus]|uniref:Uncharacterized protein n=1 Tax=Culex quinquefasciatus TaxID=7176 RepID=B0WMN6_CULQU|nr:hypothetical protein CpipJ_CPIJ008242 [Culex quinquefasciatus]|eukprot:XP_001849970.1 hypothetical protein CpipJ_CPIJ008242 [Culex quinquefasciatus]
MYSRFLVHSQFHQKLLKKENTTSETMNPTLLVLLLVMAILMISGVEMAPQSATERSRGNYGTGPQPIPSNWESKVGDWYQVSTD